MAPLIQVLPEEIANRIAAGEVVERPASIVKELLENALDAGAHRLDLELEGGGVRLVRVRDDGHGMSPEDLVLCIQSHATSKISNVDDLFRVASFGFRGEALPSIASVSETTITSRRADEDVGCRVICRGGDVEGPTPAGAPVGTTVEVRNLFFNVPARRKFLKAERTELSHALEQVTRLLLPEPEVEIRVAHNGKRVLEVGADTDLRARIGALFGRRLAEPLLECEAVDGDLRLGALIGPPSLVRGNSRHQYLFVNGRFIKDRSVGFAIKDAFRGLIMPKEHPVAFVFIEMDPAQVDVNVHPTKTEVRFRDKDRVFGLVRRSLRGRLMAEEGDRPLKMRGEETAAGAPTRSAGTSSRPAGTPSRAEMLADFERELFADAASVSTEGAAPGSAPTVAPARHVSWSADAPADPGVRADTNPCKGHGAARPVPMAETDAGSSGRFIQVHRSYIIVESPEGLRIVDQHALHERRLFEDLLRRFDAAEGEDQRLLVPEVVDLGAADQAMLLDKLEEVRALGIDIQPFGGTSVCVQAVPVALSKMSPEDLVHDLVATLREENAKLDRRELCYEVAAGLACRAAVKFNDPLPEEEIGALLKWSSENPDSRNCPHGRPVAVSISLRDLENQFQRKK